jgi:hypothetical protein
MACGIRTAKLSPHFETVISLCMLIYSEYTRRQLQVGNDRSGLATALNANQANAVV